MRRFACSSFLLVALSLPAYGVCSAPAAPEIVHSPADVLSVGQTYAVIFSQTAGESGSYIAERATSASFVSGVEVQYCGTDAASFVAVSAGTYFHRVRAVAGCDASLRSAPSRVVSVFVGVVALAMAETSPGPLDVVVHAVAPAPAGQSMLIVPAAVSFPGVAGSYWATKLRIQNTSSWEIGLELVFTPLKGIPGHEPLGASLAMAPNASVEIDDVVSALFHVTATGSLEVRVPQRSADVLTVSAPTLRLAGYLFPDAEYFSPVFRRGEGARLGAPHKVAGVVGTERIMTSLVLVETSRTAETMETAVTLKLFDRGGASLGSLVYELPAGGSMQLSNLGQLFGTGQIQEASLEVSINSGNGSVAAFLHQIDKVTGESAGCYTSEPLDRAGSTKAAPETTLVSNLHAVIGVVHGKPAGSLIDFRTLLGITSLGSGASATLSLLSDRAMATPHVPLTIPAGTTVEYSDALQQLFHLLPDVPTRGTVMIETSDDILVYGSLLSPDRPADSPITGNLPTITVVSEALLGATEGLQRPVFFSGLEQLLDPSKGGRWRLELTELARAPAEVAVYLYEPSGGNTPVAKRVFVLAPRQHLVLDTIFREMGLEDGPVTRDRRDVKVVVFPTRGPGRVAATATGYYQASGREAKYILTPGGGIRGDGTSLAAPLLPPIDDSRHRPVRR